jgi:oxygen-dependent protoporphyrinogen oxidase
MPCAVSLETCVVVVGGGISGLTAAYELSRRHIPFLLLEASPRFGGLIQTEAIDGFVIDAGPETILTQKPAGVDLCRELGLPLSAPQTTGTFIARGGTLRRLPEGGAFGIPTDWRAFVSTRAFSTVGKIRMATEYVRPARPPVVDESIASFIRRRFGSEALRYLGEPLLAGIHGGDAERLSMRALFPRLLDLERREGSLIKAFRRMMRQGTPKAASPFSAPPNGMQELVSALTRALPAEQLMRGTEVRAIERGQQWRIHLNSGATVDASAVILATPPRASAHVVQDCDPVLAMLCRQVRDVSLVTVALGFERSAVRHPLQGSGFVVPRVEEANVTAVTWVSSKWRGRAPDGRVLLRAYLGGARDPTAIDLSDRELITRVQHDFRRFLKITAEPVLALVFRWPNAGVQLEVGHTDLIAMVEARLDRQPGLFLSAAGFRGVGIADCVADARRQAEAAAQYGTAEKAATNGKKPGRLAALPRFLST